MLVMNLGIFTLSIILLWGLFIVAKIHAFKFKNFSNHIVKVTNFLFIFLTILSLLGYTIIFFSSDNSVNVDNYDSGNIEEVNY